MRFIKFSLFRYRVSLYISQVTSVTGINSDLVGGGHVIMWEFDDTDQAPVIAALRSTQARFHLPEIILLRSHPNGGYHAYCFKRTPWVRSIHIVSGTNGVDPGYISMCAMRQHWTLRTSDKGQGLPKFHMLLDSKQPTDCSYRDFKDAVRYETWRMR